MRAAFRFLLLMLIAAILSVAVASVLFVGISAANELRIEAGNAALFMGLYLPCFFVLSYLLTHWREREEN